MLLEQELNLISTTFKTISQPHTLSKGFKSLRLKQFSKLRAIILKKYRDRCFNIFITFMQKLGDSKTKNNNDLGLNKDESDLQLLAISTIADIYAAKNENRLFVKQALKTINEGEYDQVCKNLWHGKIFSGKNKAPISAVHNACPKRNRKLGTRISLELLLETDKKTK